MTFSWVIGLSFIAGTIEGIDLKIRLAALIKSSSAPAAGETRMAAATTLKLRAKESSRTDNSSCEVSLSVLVES